MTWLIAGFGDLGREMADNMQADPDLAGETVLALRRHIPKPEPSDAKNNSSNLRWLKADLSNRESLRQLPADINHVVFCATPDQRDEVSYRETYVKGLKNLLQALKDTGNAQARVLFVSSTAVYGAEQTGWLNETSIAEPSGFNGRVLLEAERELTKQWSDPLILRLSGIYGPNRVFLLKQLLAGATSVPASDAYWANRIHVTDAALAVIHLLKRKNLTGTYIGTDSTPVPLKTLYGDLAAAIGAPSPREGPPSSMMGKKRLSNQKLCDSGFTFRWPDCRQGYAAILANENWRD
jgi:nucleoside-diphosphate-sugar epimerase|uniref:NAD-dependent epimerase/dehydratase family protein n=1 Tax=Orrella sp. TaxID=1921583 RepID=UPI004048433D